MINIYKLIRSVKKGELPLGSFNLRMKKADAADDWLAKQEAEQAAKKQKEQVKVPAGVPSGVPAGVPAGVPDGVPAGVPDGVPAGDPNQSHREMSDADRETIYYFIKNFGQEMKNEGRKPISQLKKDIDDGVLPPLADIKVYNLVKDNPVAHNALSAEISRIINIDINKANMFVDMSVSNSKKIFDGIDEASEELSVQEKGDIELKEIEERKRLAKERAEALALEKDPYFKVESPPDPKLDLVFMERWGEMERKSKEATEAGVNAAAELVRAKKIMGLELTPKEVQSGIIDKVEGEPADAVLYRFGHGQEGQVVDQKINFFLNYPQHIAAVMDDELVSVLAQELPKQGINAGEGSSGDIMNALGNLRGDNVEGGTKGRVIRILLKHKGQKLYDILRGLIEKGDDDIYEWVAKRIWGEQQNRGKGQERTNLGPEDVSLGNVGVNEESDVKGKGADVRDVYMEHLASEIIGNVTNTYLTPDVKNAQKVMKSGVGQMSSDSIDKFKTGTEKEKKAALDNYNLSEMFYAFSIPMIDHLEDLFRNKGQKLLNDPNQMAFRNKNGKIFLPKDIVKEVLRTPTPDELEEGEQKVSHDDYKGLANRYMTRVKKKTAKSIVPKWSELVSINYPVDVFRKMSKLKQNVKQIAKVNNITADSDSFDIVREHLPGMLTGGLDSLSDFARVEKGDSREVEKAKVDDFIRMTLSQSDFHTKWLFDLGHQREGEQTGRSFPAKSYDDAFWNILSIIGGRVYKLYGYLANEKDVADYVSESNELVSKMSYQGYQPTPEDIEKINQAQNFTPKDLERSKTYTDGALDIVIGLLDHHPDIRNFLKMGSRVNTIDRKRRTNTELYYELSGKEPPEHLSAIFDISNTGRKKAEEKAVRGELSRPNLLSDPFYEKGSWYDKFFEKYKTFDPIIRAKQKVLARYDQIDEDEEKLYQDKNKKILQYLENDKFKQKLKAIKDPMHQEEIQKTIDDWQEGDITERLDPVVYKALGFNTFDSQLTNLEKKRKAVYDGYPKPKKPDQMGVAKIEALTEKIKDELKAMILENQAGLAEDDLNPEDLLKRLKLAKEAYDRAMFKIAALERMKKHNVKFASVNNIDYLDLQIAKVKAEFDDYFNSLFF